MSALISEPGRLASRPDCSARGGFFLGLLRERKAAVVGLALIVLFVAAGDHRAADLAVQRHRPDLCRVRAAVRSTTGSAATTAASTCSAS